jgi:hypothetical protein
MLAICRKTSYYFLICTVGVYLLAPGIALDAILYKSYVVRSDGGQDILCDPYVVQKDDYVIKIFKQRGEISHKDFPEFLNIFKRLNPHISDVNLIRPGQHIFIPLKKLAPDAYPGQETGIVTIPFVTINSIPDLIKKNSTRRKVRRGDTVSVLISRKFGTYGTDLYKEGIRLFKQMNPDIKNINQIRVGQELTLPDPSLINQPWYESLFDSSGRIRQDALADASVNPLEASDAMAKAYPPKKDTSDEPKSPFEVAAGILEGKLYDKGVYYFPGQEEDFGLDLAHTPVIEMKDGSRILFSAPEDLEEDDIATIQSFWRKLKVASIPPGANLEDILNAAFKFTSETIEEDLLWFNDNGIVVEVKGQWFQRVAEADSANGATISTTIIKNPSQQTPDSILRYVEQHNIVLRELFSNGIPASKKTHQKTYTIPEFDTFTIGTFTRQVIINDLAKVLGFSYAPNTRISFPYGGIQIQALSNLLTSESGKEVLIDFGELHREAIEILERTGFHIVQIYEEDPVQDMITKIAGAFKIVFVKDPLIWTANRPQTYNTSVMIPGVLVKKIDHGQMLFTEVPIDYELYQFLVDRKIEVIMIQ